MHKTRSLMYGALGLLLGITGLGLCFGCEQDQRFKVPKSAVHKKSASIAKKRYQTKGKVKIPRNRKLPLWTEMVDTAIGGQVFRSESVLLRGARWSREGTSRIYDFYFQRDNHMTARTLLQVANRLAFFVSRWTARPFHKRISVVLAPWKEPKMSSTSHIKNKTTASITKTVQPKKKTNKSTTKPIVRAASQPVSQPTSRPIPKRKIKLVVGTKSKATTKVKVTKKKVKQRKELPDVGSLRIVIYTGTKNSPIYSRFGLISTLLEKTMRLLVSGESRSLPENMWRSIAIPEYFATRGNGAIVDRSFDRTSTGLFRSYLKRMGRPNVSEALRLLSAYKNGQLPKLLHLQARRVSMSFVGFIEDAYGRGVLAALLRDLLDVKTQSFAESLKRVIGKKEKVLWNEWFHHYYIDQWKLVLQELAPLHTLPDPSPILPRR